MDDIEGLIRDQNHPDRSAITPPDTEYEMKVGSAFIDIEHPHSLDPAETNASESPAHNLPYRLHKAADVPFRFPNYIPQGLVLPAVPFPIVQCRTLPVASPPDIDR